MCGARAGLWAALCAASLSVQAHAAPCAVGVQATRSRSRSSASISTPSFRAAWSRACGSTSWPSTTPPRPRAGCTTTAWCSPRIAAPRTRRWPRRCLWASTATWTTTCWATSTAWPCGSAHCHWLKCRTCTPTAAARLRCRRAHWSRGTRSRAPWTDRVLRWRTCRPAATRFCC
jgi:hypothetical protein